MRFLTFRSRGNYWSSSKLSLYIRSKFGLTNPKWNTIEGWDDHKEFCKKKAPIIHWITDKGFDKLQDIWLFIPDLIWTIKVAPLWKFFRTLYIFRKALWNYRSWDFTGMTGIMETAARDMSGYHKHHGHLVKADKSAKELLIFAELLKRISDDDFSKDKVDFVKTSEKGIFSGYKHVQKPNTLPNYNHSKTFYTIERSVQRQNLARAAKMFERKLTSWWD